MNEIFDSGSKIAYFSNFPEVAVGPKKQNITAGPKKQNISWLLTRSENHFESNHISFSSSLGKVFQLTV